MEQAAQDLGTVTVQTPLAVALKASPTSAGAAPLTIQFTGTASGGNEIPGDTTDNTTDTATTQGESLPNEAARNAFDDNPAIKWLDFANSNPSTRASWIQFRHAPAVQPLVTGYALTSANDFPHAIRRTGGCSARTMPARTGARSTSRPTTRSPAAARASCWPSRILRVTTLPSAD